MNEHTQPRVARPLGAFVIIDLVMAVFAATVLFMTLVGVVMGGLPETAWDVADMIDAGAELAPLFLLMAWVVLAVLVLDSHPRSTQHRHALGRYLRDRRRKNETAAGSVSGGRHSNE
ncbi:MAG TPA: hypothetical protein VGR77_03080 [Candidatus Dormibacteraeota bacterium]|nr:hypothetical protein [Candidatus Dormibacteraeota bacterium]